ncbi:class I SAM-dependent methyltransferase [Streptomyces sp. J2-1]|uniref:methyltransferase domain-containing protein n=1 Tax=Streptomyces corallincola TaxID=2851888 RepID=UPI001C385C12|nr:class I SAM-dependent methyltransferase [Streptomyces corallincola]MBV2358089.1 class I SAM-dependent methyltransferase [Streptomyces corallincola]
MDRVTTPTPDLWHHYGRTRNATDLAVPDHFSWTWDQTGGPGTEILGDITDRHIADLGAGAARHAAHLAVHHSPTRITAVDASPAQHSMATTLYGHLTPRLHLTHCDVSQHLRSTTSTYDVLYSIFGAIDFTDPRVLLPATATALRPGGRLVFSTLAHHIDGTPAHPDLHHTEIHAKTPTGTPTHMRRWVLRKQVWQNLLSESGFTRITTEQLPSNATPRTAATLLVTAYTPEDGA